MAGLVLAALAAPTTSARAHDDLDLPDLVPRKPFHIAVGAGLATPGPAIRFTLVSENRGQYALDLVANVGGLDTEGRVAGQCVAWEAAVCTERRPTDEFIYDPAHEHYHFPDFALYEVRKLTQTGLPDMTASGVVGSTRKISFCLEDTKPNNEDTTFTGFTQVGFYSGCNDLRQGISAGWGDEYVYRLYGQEIPIAGIPDGSYALVITLNTDGSLYEKTRANNTSYQRIRLTRYGESGSYAEVTLLP